MTRREFITMLGAAAAACVHLGAALNVLICSITGFHSACSVSVRGRDGRGCGPGRGPADIGTPSELPTGGAPGPAPAEARGSS